MAAYIGESVSADFLKHFDLLKKVGVWENIEALQGTVHRLEELISEAVEILSQDSVDELIQFVISRLLNKFIPAYLIFMFEDPSTMEVLFFPFRNLKPMDEKIEYAGYGGLKEFFGVYPNAIGFSLLEYKLNRPEVTDPLARYLPEFLVPMTGPGGVHGLILFGQKVVGQGYSQEEIEYAQRLMNFFSISIQNNLHHRSSITDYKTRLYNHSYFQRRLEEELSRLDRHGTNLGLIVLDIDHFKRLNDTYGHLAGDEVLMHLGQTLRQSIRSEDIPARFGGEEFVIILVECSKRNLWNVAERIRKAVEAMEVSFGSERLRITISLGCSHAAPGFSLSAGEMVRMADAALYASKSGGRNRTSLARAGLLFKAARIRH